jgi:hypothetical protein
MIRLELKGILFDLTVAGMCFLLIAGLSHHLNRAKGDSCGNSSRAASAAQPR